MPIKTVSDAQDRPTESELIARAKAMQPMLRERAQACEDLRRVPDETMQAFHEAGFFKILQPAAYGGYEMRPLTAFKVSMELAKACPSSAWVENLLSVHNWEIALIDPRTAEDVWGEDPTLLLSSSYAPFGKVEVVEGGYKVTGRWPWSSGCDHGQWVILGGAIRGPEGIDPRAFIIPRSDYEIDDTWFVIGLKGTGSKDIVVKDAFVPEHRTHAFKRSFSRTEIGWQTFDAPGYKYPFGIVFAYCLAVNTIGMAEGALETFQEDMAKRTAAYDNAKALEDPKTG